MWKALDHPHAVPLLGVPRDRSRLQFAMVSEWMTNGNINEFVRANRDENRSKLVRSRPRPCYVHQVLNQRTFVARGLIYLYSQEMIHGDLKGVRSQELRP